MPSVLVDVVVAVPIDVPVDDAIDGPLVAVPIDVPIDVPVDVAVDDPVNVVVDGLVDVVVEGLVDDADYGPVDVPVTIHEQEIMTQEDLDFFNEFDFSTPFENQPLPFQDQHVPQENQLVPPYEELVPPCDQLPVPPSDVLPVPPTNQGILQTKHGVSICHGQPPKSKQCQSKSKENHHPTNDKDNYPAAASTNSIPQGGSEKYGTWMLISRKDKRNQPKRTNQQAYGPYTDRRQVTQVGHAPEFEGLGTQSCFATLEGLEETNVDHGQDNIPRIAALQQTDDALPRIKMNGKGIQRSPVQGNAGSHRKARGEESSQQVQFNNQDRFQEGNYAGYQMAHWGSSQPAYRGGLMNSTR
nr:Cell division protein FtsH [Ipomoea batatas]